MSPLRLSATVVLLGVLSACSSAPFASSPAPPATVTPNELSGPLPLQQELNLRAAIHDGFEDEAQWSRLFIVHAFGRTSDLRDVTEHFIGAEDSIVQALQPFYGDAFASSLTTLLHERANDLIGLVTAASSSLVVTAGPGDRTTLFTNADAIANLVSSVAPGISNDDVDTELRGSVQSMLDQVDARAHTDWISDVAAYEAVLGHDLQAADLLTNAMVAQFNIQPSDLSPANKALHFTLRQLFDEDVFWTRDAIVGQVIGTPDAPFAVVAAVDATTAIGNTFGTYYGPDVALELARQVHLVTITDAVAYMFAQGSGSAQAMSDIHAQWTSDANALAAYMSQLSSSWSLASLQRWLGVYEEETKIEIDARFARDYQADVVAYDAILGDARNVSFVFADGLGKAFLQ